MKIERLADKIFLGSYLDLENKVVLITGGNSGIGAGLSEAFVMQKCKVIILAQDEQKGIDFCSSIEKDYSVKPLFFACDLRNISDVKNIVKKLESIYGHVDILVNNAANDQRHKLEELSVEQWDNLMNINLRPFFFLTQMLAPGMKKKGAGVVINFSSNSQILGLSGYPAYVAAKGGIVAITKALGRELGPSGIRVNCIVPGWVMTERQKEFWITEESLAECLQGQSIKKTIELHHIASCVLFMASNASEMMTGQTLVVDGGRV